VDSDSPDTIIRESRRSMVVITAVVIGLRNQRVPCGASLMALRLAGTADAAETPTRPGRYALRRRGKANGHRLRSDIHSSE